MGEPMRGKTIRNAVLGGATWMMAVACGGVMVADETFESLSEELSNAEIPAEATEAESRGSVVAACRAYIEANNAAECIPCQHGRLHDVQ